MVAQTALHRLHQLQHGPPRLPHQLVPGRRLLLVEVEHLVPEDIVGQPGLDLADALFGEVGLSGFGRPGHHVDVRMLPLVVEGGVPAEVRGRYFHRRRDLVAVGADEISPRCGVVEAQPRRILPLEGEDVRPHISGVLLQFLHRFFQRHAVAVPEQTVGTQPLRPGPGGDILQILLRLPERVPVGFQRQSEEGGGRRLGGLGLVARILVEGFGVREVLHQLGDELLLLACGRTVIRKNFYPLPRCDVAQVSRRAAGAFDIGAF